MAKRRRRYGLYPLLYVKGEWIDMEEAILIGLVKREDCPPALPGIRMVLKDDEIHVFFVN